MSITFDYDYEHRSLRSMSTSTILEHNAEISGTDHQANLSIVFRRTTLAGETFQTNKRVGLRLHRLVRHFFIRIYLSSNWVFV